MNKRLARLRRARRTRAKIAQLRKIRLCVFRSNKHIYAQITTPDGSRVLCAASSLSPDVREVVKNGGNKEAAAVVGRAIAERALALGIREVAFDRSGYLYHGRVKALAEAARAAGLQF
ncbi:MAG: 50S ribosomal protein L18 [Hydrogenophilus sp.]|nr:50S ribosomal protein L18 [Hydrogenophilus sp.]